jgi:uracil-DNA glycosylase family 4
MVTIEYGDYWSIEANIRVNPVNCVGVMGAGLAGEFKRRYPVMFAAYKEACAENDLRPGKLHIYIDPDGGPTIVNFPTKRHWQNKSRMEDIDAGLIALREYLRFHVGSVVVIPAIGCGLGGLVWAVVFELIKTKLDDLHCDVRVFPPMEVKTTETIEPAKQLRIAHRAIIRCHQCELSKTRTKAVHSSGDGRSTIAMVGEAPGAEEDARGLPFIGRAGQYLRKLIRDTEGPSPDSLLICNTVQCRPPENRLPEDDEIAACKPHLWRQLNAIKPRILICVGRTSAILLTQSKRGSRMEDLVGRWIIANWWGPQYPVLRVIYHPSFLLQHGQKHINETLDDLREVWQRARS